MIPISTTCRKNIIFANWHESLYFYIANIIVGLKVLLGMFLTLQWWEMTTFRRYHFGIYNPELKLLHFLDIALKFVPKNSVNNQPILLQRITWRRNDKALFEPTKI